MRVYLLVVILAALRVFPALASDNSCFVQQRDLFLTRAGDTPINVLQWAAIPDREKWNASAPQSFNYVVYSQPEYGGRSVHFSYELKVDQSVIRVSVEFSHPPLFSGKQLQVEVNYTVINEGQIRFLGIEKYTAGANCVLTQDSSDSSIFTTIDHIVHVVSIHSGAGKAQGHKVQEISREIFAGSQWINSVRSAAEVLSRAGQSVSYIEDINDVRILHTKINRLKGFEVQNFLTHKKETVDGAQVDYTGLPMSIRYFDLSEGYRRIEYWVKDELYGLAETLPKAEWLKATPRSEGKEIKTLGFRKKDFKAPVLRYQIHGLGKAPDFANQHQYFNAALESSDKGWTWTVTSSFPPRPRPVAIAWDSPNPPEDQLYLQKSKYIQFDPVADLVAQVRARLQPQTDRLQAAQIIAQVLNSRLSFDKAAVKAAIVLRRSTSDILASGRGVCQHFAAVFAAIARPLGIPTRLREGYRFSAGKTVGHAWVEVKVNADTWWPLEPQNTSEHLMRHGYLPIGEMREYESEGDTSESELKFMLQKMEIYKPWLRKVTIQKID